MSDVEAKLAARWKKNAMNWHRDKYGEKPVLERRERIEEGKSADEVHKESFEQELALLNDLKDIVNESELEANRKSVFIGVLRSAEERLSSGTVHARLPDIVHNLAEKDELKNRVLEATKRYNIDGQSFYYLWGLE